MRRQGLITMVVVLAGLILAPVQIAGAETPTCRPTKPGGRYDFAGDPTSFQNGATGSGTIWSVKASDDVYYLSAKLIRGPADGKIATWARIKFSPTASGLVWPVNRAARTYGVLGVDVARSVIEEKANTGNPAAVKSRRCARDDGA